MQVPQRAEVNNDDKWIQRGTCLNSFVFRTKSNVFSCIFGVFFQCFCFFCMFGSSIWVERRRKPLRARREAMGTRAALQHCHCTVCQTAWCLPRPTKKNRRCSSAICNCNNSFVKQRSTCTGFADVRLQSTCNMDWRCLILQCDCWILEFLHFETA